MGGSSDQSAGHVIRMMIAVMRLMAPLIGRAVARVQWGRRLRTFARSGLTDTVIGVERGAATTEQRPSCFMMERDAKNVISVCGKGVND